MNEPSSEDQKKDRAAYAAIVPFLLAEAIILVLVFTQFEVSKTFYGILLGANIGLALIFAVVAGGTRKSR